MADELIKLKNNDDVKAVVFRVNSREVALIYPSRYGVKLSS